MASSGHSVMGLLFHIVAVGVRFFLLRKLHANKLMTSAGIQSINSKV
jgi:hypothetical protein